MANSKWIDEMKYFITGATGFIGSWAARDLTERGNGVKCLVRKTSNLKWIKELPVELHYGSLSERETLKAGIEHADYVLHIAGVTKALSIEEYYKGNVESTRNILEVVREINPDIKKFVHVSSQAAVGPSAAGAPVDEESAMRPITDYGRSKMQTEEVVREYMESIPITIVRPPTVYGPRDTDVFEVFKNVKYRVNLQVGSSDPMVSIIHVHDLARGIIQAGEHPRSAGEIYFIANENPCAWSEVIGILEEIMKRKVINIPIPYPIAYSVGAAMEAAAHITGKPTILNRQKIREVNAGRWVASTKKIKEQLNFTTELSLREGLRQTYEWYRREGWL